MVSTTAIPGISSPPSTRRWSLRRTHIGVGLLATATALWLGLTAPTVSPVSPVSPAPPPPAVVANAAP